MEKKVKPYIEVLKEIYDDQYVADKQAQCPDYFFYVVNHAENVRKIWEKLWKLVDGVGIEFWLEDCEFFTINNSIEYHDTSKFSPMEFYAYSQYFFPTDEKSKDIFDRGWNHHQKSNPHHWQYWLMYKGSEFKVLHMPFSDAIEMLCDWGAMSYQFGGTPSIWYEKQTDMMIDDRTKKLIERWLPKIDEAVAACRQAC
jgi:hypothetical protein